MVGACTVALEHGPLHRQNAAVAGMMTIVLTGAEATQSIYDKIIRYLFIKDNATIARMVLLTFTHCETFIKVTGEKTVQNGNLTTRKTICPSNTVPPPPAPPPQRVR